MGWVRNFGKNLPRVEPISDCEFQPLKVSSLCTIEKTQFSIAKIMKEQSAQSEIATEYILEFFNFSVALRMH